MINTYHVRERIEVSVDGDFWMEREYLNHEGNQVRCLMEGYNTFSTIWTLHRKSRNQPEPEPIIEAPNEMPVFRFTKQNRPEPKPQVKAKKIIRNEYQPKETNYLAGLFEKPTPQETDRKSVV